MRKTLLLLATAAAVAYAPAASAADIFVGNPTNVPGASFDVTGDIFSGSISASFGRNGLSAGTFTDRFLFTIPQNGLGSGSITSILAGLAGGATDLDFQSVTFDNGMSVFNVPTMNLGGQETGGLSNVPITAGMQNILSITYLSRGAGSYGGNLSFAPSAIPEPGTWAMMLLGFGGIGLMLRSRRRQQTRVSYAF
jgi:hypothetical protein